MQIQGGYGWFGRFLQGKNIDLNSRHTRKCHSALARPHKKTPQLRGFVIGGGVTRTHEARRRGIYSPL
jgi:hypothetical protein